jgi:hypothetical protein
VSALTLEPTLDGTTHWSARRMAARTGISTATIQHVGRSAGFTPHRTETFRCGSDPQLEAKASDVVRLCLAPPEHAIVLRLDEKTQIQALNRT